MSISFTVNAPDANRRLDRVLQRELGAVPPSLVHRLLRQRKVRVNGRRGRADQRLRTGDVVEVHYALRSRGAPSVLGRSEALGPYAGAPIQILRRDGEFLFLEKPAGVSCSDDGNDPQAVARWLRSHLAEEIRRGEARPEPCHRLDRNTTGVLAVALTAAAFERFRRALAERRLRKLYEVAVWGAPPWEERLVEQALERLPRARRRAPRMIPATAGTRASRILPASTRLRVLRRAPNATLLEAEPISGRTHQIRAHCLSLGLPVIGDPRYGDAHRDRQCPPAQRLGRQLLHARELRLREERGEISARTDWPAEARLVLLELGLSD
jgi:23S rRNA pseudouridine955/2504/2580 synthase